MMAEPRQQAPGRQPQLWWLLTSIVVLIAIASRAWWFYDNFLKHDEPPIEVGEDAFGTGQMVDMYADAKVSPRQFNETYRGKPFAASGTFNYAEQDYFRYEISLLVYAYFVTCRTRDVTTVALAKQLIAGFPVKVSGLIDYMDDRTLHLSRCALHRPRPGCDTWGARCSDP